VKEARNKMPHTVFCNSTGMKCSEKANPRDRRQEDCLGLINIKDVCRVMGILKNQT
jgi:hypothetical protein